MSKEIKAGLIAILAIVGFVVLYQFMNGKNLFSTDNVFYAKYDNVEGLQPSSVVSINGLKVGQVVEIKPITDPSGKIHFVVKITVDNKFNFSKKSTMEIFESGLMSDKALRINLAYGGQLAKDGDTLSSAYKESLMSNISSQVGPVKEQLQGVLKRVDSLMMNTSQIVDERNRAEIRNLLRNLNTTVASVDVMSKQANTLISNNNPRLQSVLDNANLASISARKAVDDYGKIAQQVDTKKLNQTIDELSQTSAKLNSVITGINNGEGSIGKLAKNEELYRNLNNTVRRLDSLIIDVKAHPKRYVNFSVFGKNVD